MKIYKKKLIFVIVSIIILSGFGYVSFDKSFDIDKEFNGAAYQLGEDNITSEQTILKMKGYGRRNLFGKYWFDGILEIDGKKYNLIYESDGSNTLSYSSPQGFARTFGDVYFDKDFSSVSIRILEEEWSNQDGNMLAYPCDTKDEGLEIANILMADQLVLMGIPSLK